MVLFLPNLPDLGIFNSILRSYYKLEPRPRSDDITQGVQAIWRDPLWALTRQWQVGEFKGDDAASPIKTYLTMKSTKITRLKLNDENLTSRFIDPNIPLESEVERQKIIFSDKNPMWRTRVQLGQFFERELRRKLHGTAQDIIDDVFLILRKNIGILPSQVEYNGMDSRSRDFLLIIVGPHINVDLEKPRIIDGKLLLNLNQTEIIDYLKNPEGTDYSGNNALVSSIMESINYIKTKFQLFIYQPEGTESAWKSQRLEYDFSISAKSDETHQVVLAAREYNGQSLDWYDFSKHYEPSNLSPDIEIKDETGNLIQSVEEENLPITTGVLESIPTNISFHGSPNHRWWEFEDAKIDFGSLQLDQIDLGKLLVMNFALVFGNDWFIIPHDMDYGSLNEILTLEVIDVFGQKQEIKHPRDLDKIFFDENSVDSQWNVWDVFSIAIENNKENIQLVNPCSTPKSMRSLFIPPIVHWKEESDPIEQVKFLRDEMANKIWGVESIVQNAIGSGVSGFDATLLKTQKELSSKYKRHLNNLHQLINLDSDNNQNNIIEKLDERIQQNMLQTASNNGVTSLNGLNPNDKTIDELIEIITNEAIQTTKIHEILAILDNAGIDYSQKILDIRKKIGEFLCNKNSENFYAILEELIEQPENEEETLTKIRQVSIDSAIKSKPKIEEIILIGTGGLRVLLDGLKSAYTEIIDLINPAKLTTFEKLETLTRDSLKILENLIIPQDFQIDEINSNDLGNRIKSLIETSHQYIDDLDFEEKDNTLPNYRFSTIVPENWIPYVNKRIDDQKRAIILEQARMIRNSDVRTVEEIEPNTQILSESEILNEETVSRAGTQVTTHFQRTRGSDGSTYLSLVRKAGLGKGEGSSGLMFDIIDDKKKDLQK